jgi:hypothetical protein
MSFLGSYLGGGKAADASIRGSEIAAEAQREALDYLKETERRPQFYREGALDQLGSLYGLSAPPSNQPEGGPIDGEYIPANPSTGNADFLQGILDDPFYEMMLERGEEGVLRNASVTGGLRSGNVQDGLYRANQDVLKELYDERISGLLGLAGLPSNANQIAQTTAGIGQTLGQGVIGAGQARQDAFGQILQAGASAAGAFSDGQLKKDIEYIGKKNGHSWYRWTWNQLAESLGLTGESEGVMAEKVEKYLPEAIGERDGFKTVNYEMLGVA